ncbi:hypothetical protein ABK040_010832 [Willaertia magna]
MIIHSSSAGSSIVNDSANIYNNQDNMQQPPEDQKEKDIEDETKRVTIYRNGTNTNGHVIFCSKFSLSYFLKRASFLFGETINFKRVFNTSGGEIHDVKLILPNEILFLSEGEDFIHLYNYHTTNGTYVVSNPHVSQYMHTDQSSTTTPHKESNFFIPPFPAPFITKELASSNNRKEKEFESFKFRLLPLLEKYDIAKEKEHFLSALFSCIGGNTCISSVDSAVDTNSSACVGNVSSSPSSNPIPLLTASTNEGITTAITSPSCNTKSSCRGKNKKKKNKALTGYNIFYRRLCSQFKQKGVEVKGQVSKTISKAWNQLNDEEKSKYDDEARQENIKSQQQLLLVQQQETENVSNSPNTKDAVVSSTTSLITSGIKSLSGLSTSTSEESLSPRSLNNNNNKRKAFEGTFPSSTPVMMVNQPFPSTRYLVPPPTSSFNLAPQQISATSMMGRSPLPSQAELYDNDKTNHLLPSFSSFSSPSTTGGQPTFPPPLQQLPSSHELYYNRSSPIPPPSFLHSPPLFPTMPIKTIENKESNNTHLYTYENPNIESLERKKQKK